MSLSLAHRILGRFPGIKWAIAGTLRRVPALDRFVRSALGNQGVRSGLLPVDAAHLPEDAMPIYQALTDAIARRQPR